MESDINGCSTCPKGAENYEAFTYRGNRLYQYDYRHTDGELFSCVMPTLEGCREERDKWLEAKNGGEI